MESSGFPEKFKLFDPVERARKVARWLFGHVLTEPRPSHSEHYKGAEHDDKPNRWDDQGTYYQPSLDEQIYDSYKDNF